MVFMEIPGLDAGADLWFAFVKMAYKERPDGLLMTGYALYSAVVC